MNRAELTNSTRLRLWQPLHTGIDLFCILIRRINRCSWISHPPQQKRWRQRHVGGGCFVPSQFHAQCGSLLEHTVQTQRSAGWALDGLVWRKRPKLLRQVWTLIQLIRRCLQNFLNCRDNVLVFKGERGENGAVTKDMSVTSETIVQFDVIPWRLMPLSFNSSTQTSDRSMSAANLHFGLISPSNWSIPSMAEVTGTFWWRKSTPKKTHTKPASGWRQLFTIRAHPANGDAWWFRSLIWGIAGTLQPEFFLPQTLKRLYSGQIHPIPLVLRLLGVGWFAQRAPLGHWQRLRRSSVQQSLPRAWNVHWRRIHLFVRSGLSWRSLRSVVRLIRQFWSSSRHLSRFRP